MIGPISSLNILPMLMGVVFFLQQKYLTPPTTATMTPEQEFQMKMMRWLSIFMMPLVMYNAPSGLAMYFMCSSGFAILESRYIRSHMAAIDAKKGPAAGAGTSVIDRKGGPKKLSFMARLQDMAEQKQQEARKRAGLPPGRPKR
jgi:membrane protein insertase Oxa1/YidC/SpoIIIJ